MTIPIIPVTLTEYKRLSLTEALSGKYVIDSTFESHNRTLKTVNAIWKNLDVPEAQLIRYKLTKLIKTQDLVSAVSKIVPAKTISIDNIGETDYVIAWFDDTHDTELNYTYYHDVYFGYSEINLIEELEDIIEKGFNPLEEDVEGFKLKSSIESVSKEDFVRFIKEKVLALQKVSLEELGDLSAYHTTWERDEEGNIIPVPDKIHIPEEIQPKSVDGEGIQDWSNIRIAKINLDIYGGANGFPYAWTVRTQFVKEKTL